MNTWILSIIVVSIVLIVSYAVYNYKPIRLNEYNENHILLRTYTTLKGKKHGRELVYYPNKQLKLDVMWENGEKNGPFAEYYENAKIAKRGKYKNDNVNIATSFVYYPTGELNKSQTESNGKPDGPFIVYFRNGQHYIEGNYKQGKLYGRYTVYALDGRVKLKKQY